MKNKPMKSKVIFLPGFIVAGVVMSYGSAAIAGCHSLESAQNEPALVTENLESLSAETQIAMQIPAPSGHKRHQPYNPIARSGTGLEGGGGGNDGGSGGGGGGW